MTDDELLAFYQEHRTPLSRTLGMEFTKVTPTRIEGEMMVTKEICTIPDIVHGGAIMAFADNVAALGAFMNLKNGERTSTIESKTNFLRGTPVGQKVFAVAIPVNIGRTLQVWQTEITREDGKLAAIVTQTQIIMPPQ